MKKKTIVIFIIVIQFLVIVFLSVFAMLKMVEGDKQMELAQKSYKEAQNQAVLLQQKIQQLRECQGKEIK
ncbi:MAG: hypothetical protein ACTHJT_17800 [Cytophaga sp.]|uniref:hypothetical protein n=1 Tax=Cytophaga sp. TaxID=29535 RepID=UPI003F823079